MKPATTITAILLMLISAGHLLRLIFQVEITANGVPVPMWPSITGCIIPFVLALLVWRENKPSNP
ncbi:MAG: hypothetical protein V1764_01085 [Nitrospirota bacterium]